MIRFALVLLLVPCWASAQTLPSALTEGASYADVRAALIEDGWTANRFGPTASASSRAKSYASRLGWTEVVDCAGSRLAPCRAEWQDWGRGAVLSIGTVGEGDDPAVDHWTLDGEPLTEPDHGGMAAWPSIADDGEGGCYMLWRTTDTVEARTAPRDDAPAIGAIAAGLTITPDDRVRALRVLRALGALRVLGDIEIDVLRDIPPQVGESYYRKLRVARGSVLGTMWYGGSEGSDFRFQAREYRGDVPAEPWQWEEYPEYAQRFERLRDPVVENWVLIQGERGGPDAWLNVSQSSIETAESICEE